MDMYEFHKKSFDLQVKLVCEQGKSLGVRTEARQRFELYHIHNFFVELCYNRLSKSITEIKGFKHNIFLEPYLDKIKLPVAEI